MENREKKIDELTKHHKSYRRKFFAGLTDEALQNWYDAMLRNKNKEAEIEHQSA